MNITQKTVSEHFRLLISSLLPALNKRIAYWTFFCYIAFGTWRDEDTGKLILSQSILAQIEGKQNDYAIGNYNASEFLEAFNKEVFPISWSNWSFISQKARVLESATLPAGIMEAITAEQQKLWKDDERVYASTGIQFSTYRQRKYRESLRNESLQQLSQSGCVEAKELLTYMNSLAPDYFFKILKNIPVAREVAMQLSKDSEHQLNLLNSIQDQYMPFYQPVAKSVRVYPLNENLAMLQKTVRKALTTGWIEADLKSAQLAIASKLWNVKDLHTFLVMKESIWKHLSEICSIDQTEENKQALKTALYALCFGASKRTISSALHTIVGDSSKIVSSFFNDKFIVSLLLARQKHYRLIIAQGGITDCFGRFLSIDDFSPRSILAQECQSMELKLLYPVIKRAIEKHKKNDGFTITLWQHDGFSFVTSQKKQAEYWKKHLQEEVQKVAFKFDIPTYLNF